MDVASVHNEIQSLQKERGQLDLRLRQIKYTNDLICFG